MFLETIPRVVLCLLAAYACLYAPGQGLVSRSGSDVPTAFARVLASAIVTTLVGTGLAAAELFSLPALLAVNAGVMLAGLAARRVAGRGNAHGQACARRDLVGPLVFLIALGAYWPAYPTFLSAADATVYVAAGASLARHGTLALEDDLGPRVPADLRAVLFDSMTQVVGSNGPPYRRMAGGIVIDSLDAKRAWPAFFPVPSVWAATMISAWSGDEVAPGYAPVFAALALWAFWLLARAWLGAGYALAAVVLLGASMPFFLNARTSLSEPVAAFFSIAGLAVLALHDARPNRRDAMLAGAALGAAIFTRVEIALVLLLAFALHPSMQPRPGSANIEACRRPPRWFFAALVAIASLTALQAISVPGTYVTPLIEHARNAWAWQVYPWAMLLMVLGQPMPQHFATMFAVYIAVIAALAVTAARRFGWSATCRWSVVLAVLAGHAMAAPFEAARTPMWLSLSVGWSVLPLALAGAVLAWRERGRLVAAPLVLSVAAAVAAILFYNPHVYPELSWGTRRFVPLLLPLIVLLACYAVARAGARSRFLAIVMLGLLSAEVATAARPLWGRPLLDGTHETLERIGAAIPGGGTILVDRELSATMIGPALWLFHDRNSLTVPPTTGPNDLPALVRHFEAAGNVYLVSHGRGSQARMPFIRMTLLTAERVGFPYLEGTYDRRPRKIVRSVRFVGVYRLESVGDPRGELVE